LGRWHGFTARANWGHDTYLPEIAAIGSGSVVHARGETHRFDM
jgi:hypothetical protein